MKRKLTIEQARELLQARITKGDAFWLGNVEYGARQEEVRAALDKLTIEEMRRRWPHHTWDWL